MNTDPPSPPPQQNATASSDHPAHPTGPAHPAALAKILLVDDDPTFRRAMAKALTRKGFAVAELGSGSAAIKAIQSEDDLIDIVVLDLQMPETTGMEVLRRTPRRRPRVIVLTGHGTIPDAVEAMRLGAFSFLLKPLDADELVPVLEQALQAGGVPGDHLVGSSPVTRQLKALLDNLAPAEDPVLLTGETGTGKEVVARYLHLRSPRGTEPFVAVNLACLPKELLESELFGHARGAFTGAERKKPGLFADAGTGTLFLDEISELPLEHQPKLLRALETRSFRAVGELREEPLRARLIVATNRDLRALVREGRFREDLYYRLAVLPVALPTLRERQADIVPIAEHWLHRLSHGAVHFTDPAREQLLAHDYPGNVRELVNVVRRVALFAQNGVVDGDLVARMVAEDPFRTLRPHSSPPSQSHPSTPHSAMQPLVSPPGALVGSPSATEPLSLRDLEIQHIRTLLREHKNITMVARLLNIDRRTLQRKLRSLGIDWRGE